MLLRHRTEAGKTTLTDEQLELDLQIKGAQKKRDAWDRKIRGYNKEFERWMKRGDRIVERYRNEDLTTGDESARLRRYALLWSNVQTLGPAIYMRPPKPEVLRRYFDKDPTARLACAVLERGLQYEMDITNFHEQMLAVRDDYLLVGRGTLWQRYEPIIDSRPGAQDTDGEKEDAPVNPENETNGAAQLGVEAIGANGGPPMVERVVGENAPTDYVHWRHLS